MYTRYLSKNGYTYEEIDKQPGDEVGIKSILINISGNNAYGYFKGERGVHRLVRISPFDAGKRRHTSFASVEVTPKFDNNININVNDSDIRVDIYRSSGPGGQGVNTTDSAVRITHLPTGIVVTCQNERSQIRNKETAMEILKSKLYNLEVMKKNNQINDLKGDQMTIGFGSAKRSYVMCPYTLVKDNDSGYETSSVDKILDGEIGEMLEKNIRR
jgi:peptide chain release factor 2